jgi:hypothetical protein
MSSQYAEPLTRLETCLDELLGIAAVFRTTTEKQDLLLRAARARTRLQALETAVLTVADDVADKAGARSPAAWLAVETRDAHGRLRDQARLGTALETRWHKLAKAFGKGEVNLAQVRVIDKALTDLPQAVGEDLIGKAESFLVDHASQHGPRELAVLGARVLEHLAPETAEQAEYARLLAEEDRAAATTRLSFHRRGDGTTDIHARLPDHAANRLRAYTDAIANPRRSTHDDDFTALPVERRRGIAFQSLLETVLDKDLPQHGQSATSIIVTIPHQTLLTGLGTATTSTGDTITAGQARRLACQAAILPAILDGDSEVLDLGRTQRFFKGPLRKALDLRDTECTTRGCHVPAAYCHGHHYRQPWAHGGNTSLHNGKLLCPFHHHRAHHPNWDTHHHPDGTTTYTRRQ